MEAGQIARNVLTRMSQKHSIREGKPQGIPKGQPEGKAVTGNDGKQEAAKSKNELRKQYEDADSAGHNNRNLRSKTKQFAGDEWE